MSCSGDPDKDFVVGTIPRRQGAIDMAKTDFVMHFGEDARPRKLAEGTVAAQQTEIVVMGACLAKHSK